MIILCLSILTSFCATPLLEVQPELHFGVVPQESLNTRTITVKNLSNTDLAGLKAVVSCSCLEVEPKTIDLKAGTSADLKVTYRPRSSSGKARNKVFFELKGHDTPVASLVVRADVYRIFESSPRKVDFGIVPLGTSPKADVQVMPLTDRSYRVQDVNFDSLLIDVDYDRNAVVSRQTPLKATVVLKPREEVCHFFNDPTDPLESGMTFSFKDTKTSETFRHSVLFKALIQGEIEVTPPKYAFPNQPHDAQLTLKVHLRHRHGKPFRIKGFSSAFGCTAADFGQDASVEHDIMLHIDASKIEGNTEDLLRFTTDSEIEKTVKMPVTILFAE